MYLSYRKLAVLFQNDNDLVEAWIRYHLKENPKLDDPDMSAMEYLDEMITEEPNKALRIMDLIVHRTTDKNILGAVGAGPLEDLLRSTYGAQFVDTVIDRARQDKNWRFAFGIVWTSSFKDKATAAKIEQHIKKFLPQGRP